MHRRWVSIFPAGQKVQEGRSNLLRPERTANAINYQTTKLGGGSCRSSGGVRLSSTGTHTRLDLQSLGREASQQIKRLFTGNISHEVDTVAAVRRWESASGGVADDARTLTSVERRARQRLHRACQHIKAVKKL